GPSVVATGQRSVTQAYAVGQFERHTGAAGLRWWSTLEASWIQVTLFDRALSGLSVRGARTLALDDEPGAAAAASYLGLAGAISQSRRRSARLGDTSKSPHPQQFRQQRQGHQSHRRVEQ